MRNITPIVLNGVTPADLSGEAAPGVELVDPRTLMVDDAYQRAPSARTFALVRRIIENWSWARFKPPVVVRVGGALHVLDGQHTALAAASHGGIATIPVLVVAAPEVSERAAAFVSHAVERVQASPLSVHRAAVVAGDSSALAIEAACREAGVALLHAAPDSGGYRPGDTVALAGIRGLVSRRGADGARAVLAALAAAGLAPISGDHITAADALLYDEVYSGEFDGERVAATFRALSPAITAEARTLAAAKALPYWRALTATLYRRAPKRARAKAPPLPPAQPARVAPAPVAAAPIPAIPAQGPPARIPRSSLHKHCGRPTPGKRLPNRLTRIIMPGAAMARIVGVGPLLRSDGIERLWKHINGNGLLDPADRRVVVADDKLRAVFGRERIAVSDLESGLGAAFVPRVSENGKDRSYIERYRGPRHPAGATV